MNVSGLARVVIAAAAKAEDRLGRDSERTICGGVGIVFLLCNPLVIARRYDKAIYS